MKTFWGLTLALLLSGLGIQALGQGVEHVTVTKSINSNPTVAIVNFSGDAKLRQKLEDVLRRCGWFSLAKSGGKCDVSISAAVGANGTLQTAVKAAGGIEFTTSHTIGADNLGVFETVDDILARLFKVRALCTKKIYFVSTGKGNLKEIFACYLDGSGQERVTRNSAISTEPSWGHGNAMVYTLARHNALNVVLMDAGKGRQRIVSSAPGLNASAGLAHDGGRLALPMSAERQVDLYVIDLRNGSRKVRLTKDKSVESSPCWSPDDRQICFVSDKLGVPQLYLTSVGQGNARRISAGNNECVSPDWSSVSNMLCFSMKDNTGHRVIAVINMADPNLQTKIITHAAGHWEAPSWAPDGRHIVCTRGNASGNVRDLYIVDSWSGAITQVSKNAKISLPAWRP